MFQLAQFATMFGSYLTLIIGVGLMLTLLYFYLAYIGTTVGLRRARRAEEQVTGAKPKRSLLTMFNRGAEEKMREDAEFLIAVGMSRKKFMRRVYVITAVFAVVLFVLTGSKILTFFLTLFVYNFAAGRGNGKVARARENSLKVELLPYARYISRTLERGGSLLEALGDLVRSDPETPLKAAIKRAMASTRTLEIGLRQEAAYATQLAVREFFEILAEGASSSQVTATTRAALDRYYDLNLRRRTVYQRAVMITAQARGTRAFMSGLIPFFYIVSVLRVGPEMMFRTTGGDIITLLACGLITAAFMVSNRTIRGVLKGF